LGSSGSECGTKSERILWRKMERCMTTVVYHEMQKTGHCLLHKSGSVNGVTSQKNCQIYLFIYLSFWHQCVQDTSIISYT
jgi:hypothetical protein